MALVDLHSITERLFHEHSGLIGDDPILFRKRVIRFMRQESGLERPAAVQQYDRTLKHLRQTKPDFVAPLLEAALQKKAAKKNRVKLQPDEECYSVLEVLDDATVGRCQSFLTRAEAESKYVSKYSLHPQVSWVLIRGLGPNSGDAYKLSPEEEELIKYYPETV